jgi:hypothetical protein
VRHLVLADRDEPRVVHRDIGRLQQRVAKESDRRQVLVRDLFALFLVGRDALEPRHGHDHRQQEVELGVLGHERLYEEGAALRVEADGDPVGDIVVRVGQQVCRVRVLTGERVPVGDEVEAVVPLLQLHPVPEGASEVPQVELSRRAHAGDDSRFHSGHVSSW